MKLVSWNCTGLGSLNKVKAIKDLLRMDPRDILLLQETQMEEEALLSLSRATWKKQGGHIASARGASGGLTTLWNKSDFTLLNSFSAKNWISTKLQNLPSKVSIALFNLYVPVHYLEKKECWNTLADFL